MAWFTGQLLLLLVLAFLLGLLLGYLVWIWGWRKRVEDDVEVTTDVREVAGGETARRTAELDARLAERDAALAERDEALGLRDARVAELEDEVRRLRGAATAAAAQRSATDEVDDGAGGGAATTAEPRRVVATESRTDAPARTATDTMDRPAAARTVERQRDTIVVEDDEIDDLRVVHLLDTIEDDGADEDDRTEEVPVVQSGAAPSGATATTVPDDLKRVEGIGPKMEAALNDAGVLTFGDLARTSEHEIRAAIVAAGMSFAPSVPTWATQAQLLADGDEDALAEYQVRLRASREESRR